MRITDIIEKKKRLEELTEREIRYAVGGFTSGEVADYQMSALLMAICLNGMTDEETWLLTQAMLESGEILDLSGISGITADKHSTGGVGDKTTLIVAPIVAACGVKVAKMSGRGLGFTGGTIDKLEAIPGYQTNITRQRFFEIVNTTGLSVIGQTAELCPADKKIYALRDVTATVDSLPLIVSSIMSKKLAMNADCLVLDVKCGSGSFCKTLDRAKELAEKLIAVGVRAGKKVSAVVTDMDRPLGYAIGNAPEVKEAVDVLTGGGPDDVREISLVLAAEMLFLAKQGSLQECRQKAANALDSGAAFERLKQSVRAHGGDVNVLTNTARLSFSAAAREVRALHDGYVQNLDAQKLGEAATALGAGRIKKDDVPDSGAGIILHCKSGTFVRTGEPLATLYSKEITRINEAEQIVRSALKISENPCGAFLRPVLGILRAVENE